MKYRISAFGAPDGFVWPWTTSMNDSGQICGYAFPSDWMSGSRPVFWPGGGAVQMLPVPGDEGVANDVNEAGDIVGRAGAWEADHSAFLHQNGTTTLLTGLPGPKSEASSINNNGLIAGTCGPSHSSRVFVYDSGQNALLETIEPLPGHELTSGGRINDDGDVVGISSSLNGQHKRLFVRRNGSTQELGKAELVAGINASGMVAGSLQSGGIHWGDAFRYVPSGSNPGFEPCGLGAEADGINDDGLVVGYYWASDPIDGYTVRPFVHIPTGHLHAGFQDLTTVIDNLAGWYALFHAQAINKTGSIAGQGVLTSGSVAVFVLEPQPAEPDFADRGLLQFLKLLGAVEVGGGGWGLPHGGPPVPIPPHGIRDLSPAQRDFFVGQLADKWATAVSSERLGTQLRKLARELMASSAKGIESK